MKVLIVLGTRPEVVKLAPVIHALERHGDRVTTSVCVTGQHREMCKPLLAFFGITPDHDLAVMTENQSPTRVAWSVMRALEPLLIESRPDCVIVQGDTTSVAAASLAAFYAGIPVGHVEAGLRTGRRDEPFPEEINRRMVSVAADLHFAPTPRARENLLREGTPAEAIHVTGNTVIDALHWTLGREELAAAPVPSIPAGAELILVTAHRRESLGEPLERICRAVADIARSYGDRVQIVYPVHLNPNVQATVRGLLGGIPNVLLIPPVDYLRFVKLMSLSKLILTDSGGIQEEAPALGKPVLVLREVTERPEAVEAGTAEVVGTDPARIVAATHRLLDDLDAYARMARAVNPFGDGHAAERIVSVLLNSGGGGPTGPY